MAARKDAGLNAVLPQNPEVQLAEERLDDRPGEVVEENARRRGREQREKRVAGELRQQDGRPEAVDGATGVKTASGGELRPFPQDIQRAQSEWDQRIAKRVREFEIALEPGRARVEHAQYPAVLEQRVVPADEQVVQPMRRVGEEEQSGLAIRQQNQDRREPVANRDEEYTAFSRGPLGKAEAPKHILQRTCGRRTGEFYAAGIGGVLAEKGDHSAGEKVQHRNRQTLCDPDAIKRRRHRHVSQIDENQLL